MLEVFFVAGFYVAAGVFAVGRIDSGGEGGIHVFKAHEATLAVHLSLRITVLVDGHDGADTCSGGDALIVGTESGGDVDDAGTVRSCDIVSRYYAEGFPVRLEPGNELMIAYAHEFRAFPRAVQDLVRDDFIAGLVGFQGNLRSFWIEPGAQKVLCKHIHGRCACIRVEGQDADIPDFRADAERRI